MISNRPARLRPALAALLLSTFLTVLACLVLPAGAVAQVQDWSGVWDTRWLNGGTRVVVRQEGNVVTGEYPLYGGAIAGRVDGNRLVGSWTEPGNGGTFVWVMSPDGQSFMGRFSDNEWWTGSRLDPTDAEDGALMTQDSPRNVLRAFLLAGEAVQNGDLQYLDDIVQLLAYPESDQDKTDELREATLLWLIIDQFQFRLTEVPLNPKADSYDLRLSRYDGEEYMLSFLRRDDQWLIAVPSQRELDRTLERLLVRTKGRVPSPSRVFRQESPRDAMEAFLDSMRAGPGGLDNAIDTLDLSELNAVTRQQEGVLLAQYLDQVLARIGEVVLQEIPNDPDSETPYVHFMHPDGDIVIAPVESDDGQKWKFTPETLRSIRHLYAAAEDLPLPRHMLPYDPDGGPVFFRIRNQLRDVLPGGLEKVGPLEAWQWIAMVVVFVLALVLAGLISISVFLVGRALHRRNRAAIGRVPQLLMWGVRLMVFGLVAYFGIGLLGLPDRFAGIAQTVAMVAMIAGSIPIEFWLIDAVRHILDRFGAISQRGDILASLLVGLIKVAIVLGNFLLLAEALQIPYGAALAGLGIGGLAVALAARSTLENVIAGFILFADRPLAVGDFCRFGQKMGTVERIGIRSTELRTRDRTVISVPNAEFVNMHLENFGRRDKILLQFTIGLRYETRPDQLRYVLAEIRRLLIAHAKVDEDPLRVRFSGFGSHSLDIEVYAYVVSTDWSDFLGIREDLYLRIMELIEAAGTGIAVPSQTLYLGRDRGLDAERGAAAEEQVKAWRAETRLPFPNFTVEEIDQAANTIPYPPEGAPRFTEQVAEGQLAERRSRRIFWPFGRQVRAP
ncbi:mechanosensitive ion channel family protein [Marinibaculum pumilum]|uniref:Mechanosensitive ion channel family protein n=1 Tax=Marinibaculum pumilum TaxID=1766165 RepID=A0ABV7KU00_9PROT